MILPFMMSENDVWVTGYYKDNTAPGKGIKPLLAHWNGQQWGLSTSPSFPTLGELYAVAVISSNDIWAVGNSLSIRDDVPDSLILHWDGQQWSSASHPKRAGTFNVTFNALTALSKNDVWLVGSDSYNHPSPYQADVSETLIEHWDGISWKIVSSPSTGLNDYLTSIAAASKSDIWAAGSTDQGVSNDPTNAGAPIAPKAQLMHWDGKSWKVVPQGLPPGQIRIALASAHDIWLISSMSDMHGVVTSTLARWDGHQWNSVSYPNLSNSGLAVVASIPGTDHVWVAWGSADKILLGPA